MLAVEVELEITLLPAIRLVNRRPQMKPVEKFRTIRLFVKAKTGYCLRKDRTSAGVL